MVKNILIMEFWLSAEVEEWHTGRINLGFAVTVAI